MCVCIIYMCVCVYIYVCVHTYIYDEAKMQQGAFCIINAQSPAIATARLHQFATRRTSCNWLRTNCNRTQPSCNCMTAPIAT